MDLSNLSEVLSFIKPEIAISIALVLIVVADLIFHNNKKFIPYIAIAGLVAAGLYTLGQIEFSGSAFTTHDNISQSNGMIAVDAFGAVFKIIVIITSLLIIYFSSLSSEIRQISTRTGEYYALIFGMILGMMVMISASDMILIYLSLELMSLSSYVLAGFTKLRERNSEASLKYLLYGSVSSGLMLFGISVIYGLTGTTNLFSINEALQSTAINPLTFGFSLILVFVGIGYKISAAPFHFWTPDVYEGAPIPITAYLSVASKAAGFALLVRLIRTSFVSYTNSDGSWELFSIFDWQSLLVIISILTMTLGNFSALWQDNLKRMLAYSSISHAGFILLGLAVLSDNGLIAIIVYFIIYMIMNIGAFFIVMIIANKIGSENIHDYDGIGFTSPFLGVALTIFLIALTGLPPTAGFISKLYIFIALVDAEMIGVAVIALLNSVVALYYYVRVLKHMFLAKPTENTPTVPSGIPVTAFILLLLIPTLLFGLYFTPIIDLAKSCVAIFIN